MNAVSDTSVTLEDDHEKFDGVQDPARSELFLVKEFDPETSPILYYKYESLDPMVSDTRHDASSPWWEQTTGTPEAKTIHGMGVQATQGHAHRRAGSAVPASGNRKGSA